MSESCPQEFVSPEWVASRYGIAISTVCAMASRGAIPAVKVGKLWRFKPAAVIARLEGKEAAPTPSPPHDET